MPPPFDKLKSEYTALWACCEVHSEHKPDVLGTARKIIANKARYEAVSARVNGVPWYVIGIIHAMECGLNFGQHLHNGDSLKRRTVQVPAGRPAKGAAPFSFEDSAVDALTMSGKQFDKITDWGIDRICYVLETYNGWGYRGKGIHSAYLWSFTNNYQAGKYVADHVWSATAVSSQSGGMAILKMLIETDASVSADVD